MARKKKFTMTAGTSSGSASGGGPNKGVLMSSLMQFLFPAHLEHPESTGRLDVFAHYGPCDDNGDLRGGFLGRHVHTDLEVRHMIWKLNRETLESLFTQPKETVAAMVEELLPKANRHHYTDKEIVKLFATICPDSDGRVQFADLQNIILKDQRRRFVTLIKGGEIGKPTRCPIPYQTQPAKDLTYITRAKKVRNCEEYLVVAKNLHTQGTLIAPYVFLIFISNFNQNAVFSKRFIRFPF